jgi:hypothetical protein
MDEVSQEIKRWYERNWSGDVADTLAKKEHEDLTDLGQAHIAASERRFIDEMAARSGEYFVDIGCGAQPRVSAGASHRYHVCLDFSLSGLLLAKKILGDRGIFVVGSITRPPLVLGFANTCLASHCIYHISEHLQASAICNAVSMLQEHGRLYVFYANPLSCELVATWPARAIMRPFRRGQRFYFRPLRIPRMKRILRANADAVAVFSLRCCSKMLTQPFFALPFSARQWFRLFRMLDTLPPSVTTYVVYIADKLQRPAGRNDAMMRNVS